MLSLSTREFLRASYNFDLFRPLIALSDCAPGIEDLEKQLNSADPDTVFTFSGVEVYIPPAAEQDMTALRAALGTARRIKTAGEIEMIRAASDISAESHNLLMKHIRYGSPRRCYLY